MSRYKEIQHLDTVIPIPNSWSYAMFTMIRLDVRIIYLCTCIVVLVYGNGKLETKNTTPEIRNDHHNFTRNHSEDSLVKRQQ